jgi:hypothetical protein
MISANASEPHNITNKTAAYCNLAIDISASLLEFRIKQILGFSLGTPRLLPWLKDLKSKLLLRRNQSAELK